MPSYLPPTNEILSYWLILVRLIHSLPPNQNPLTIPTIHPPLHQITTAQISALSLWNTIQTFIFLPNLTLTSRIYSGPHASSQLTQLSARTFAAWTFLTALVRFYAAYRIHDGGWYGLALWSFVVAGAHLGSEVVYGTVKLRSGALPSLCIAGGSTAWMVWQWGSYVG